MKLANRIFGSHLITSKEFHPLEERINQYYLGLVILFSLFYYSTAQCPEGCEACVNNHLYCASPGLSEIPRLSNFNFLKLTIQKQTFLNTDLDNRNFSSFPKMNQVSIRSSNINRVMPYTFSNLSLLQELDLSDNAELEIKEKSFSGLNLSILKLDNMGIITLDIDAFKGLQVLSLSIQNSNLLSLPSKLMEPISKNLIKLFLKNNHLRTLDPSLQTIFQSLEILQLQKNPFICNCSILWLSKILQMNSFNNAKSNQQIFESSDEEYPTCVSPAEFRKQFLHLIVNKLNYCSPPIITRIDVTFESFSSVIIDCFADDKKDSHHDIYVGWLPQKERNIDRTQLKRSIKVERHSPRRHLCRAVNSNGNSEIGFQIDWFKLPIEIKKSVNKSIDPFFIARESHGILWRNVFSLFEMICAIIGTLVITVTIFLIFCCCHGCRFHIPFFEKDRKLLYKTPPLYERGLYKNDRRFCETDIDGRLFPPPPPTPPPLPANRMLI